MTKKKIQEKDASTTRTFFAIFIPFVAAVGILLLMFYFGDRREELRGIAADEVRIMDLQKSVISKDFESVLSDLLYFSGSYELQGFLEGTYSRELVALDFASFMKRKGMYDSISFLDNGGREIVRVDTGKARPRIVPDDELRDKNRKDYFSEIIPLSREEIFVSPFELDREGAGDEGPAKPVIRFGTPVFDRNNNRQGALLFNYLGTGLIEGFKKIGADSAGEVLLLDSDGYWLISPRREDEWAAREGDSDKAFGNEYPKVWRRMASEESGQFYGAGGLFTYSTVYPLMGALGVRSGLRDFSEETPEWLGAKEYAWKIVSIVPKDVLSASAGKASKRYILLFAVIIIFSGVSLFLFNLRHPVHITVD